MLKREKVRVYETLYTFLLRREDKVEIQLNDSRFDDLSLLIRFARLLVERDLTIEFLELFVSVVDAALK